MVRERERMRRRSETFAFERASIHTIHDSRCGMPSIAIQFLYFFRVRTARSRRFFSEYTFCGIILRQNMEHNSRRLIKLQWEYPMHCKQNIRSIEWYSCDAGAGVGGGGGAGRCECVCVYVWGRVVLHSPFSFRHLMSSFRTVVLIMAEPESPANAFRIPIKPTQRTPLCHLIAHNTQFAPYSHRTSHSSHIHVFTNILLVYPRCRAKTNGGGRCEKQCGIYGNNRT